MVPTSAGEGSPIEVVLYARPFSTHALRGFAIWCARRVWHFGESSDDDLARRAHLRCARALTVARRETRGRASSEELLAAWLGAGDRRAATTGWFPTRLANAGAFRSAARMAARFACRETCHPDATMAAVATSRSAAWAMGYSAAGGSLGRELDRAAGRQEDRSQRLCWVRTVRVGLHLADDVRWAAEGEHARELRRWSV